MKKKVLALLLTAAVTASLLAGCGSKENPSNTDASSVQKTENTAETQKESAETTKKDPVTLAYWYWNAVGEQEYTQQVEDKLNEILATTEGYEHITVDLHPCKDYKTDLSLALAAGEQVDIISLPGSGSEAEHVKDGVLVALDDYLAANPEISAELPEWLMEMGIFDGTTYYVPNYQQASNQAFGYMNKEVFEATGYDYDEVQQAFYNKDQAYLTKFMESALTAAKTTVKKDNPDKTYIGANALGNIFFYVESGQSGFPSVGGQTRFYWDFDEEEVKFSDLDEDVQAGYLQNAKWYTEGLLSKDRMTNPEPYNNGLLGEYSEVFMYLSSFGTADMVAANRNSSESALAQDGEVVVWNVDDHNVIGLRNAAQGVGVSATSKHPEDAANFLALLFNSKYEEFYNTLCYGLEGIHYNVISDGKIETTEFEGPQGGADTTYCYWKWVGGNTFNAWLNQSMTQEQEDYILNDLNESDNTIVCPLAGMVVDTTPIDTELTQLKSIYEEYHEAIIFGVKGADQEAYLKEYLDKMEAAGLSKVLEELNAQAKAYLASK